MTYRYILVDAHDVAASCVALGRLVTIFYVGKEQRGKKSSTLLYRVWEHCTSSGNADLGEFAALYGHGGQQVLYTLVMLEADSVLAEFAQVLPRRRAVLQRQAAALTLKLLLPVLLLLLQGEAELLGVPEGLAPVLRLAVALPGTVVLALLLAEGVGAALLLPLCVCVPL